MNRRRDRLHLAQLEDLSFINRMDHVDPMLNNGIFRDDFGQAFIKDQDKPDANNYSAIYTGLSDIRHVFSTVFRMDKDADQTIGWQVINPAFLSMRNLLIRLPIANANNDGTRSVAIVGIVDLTNGIANAKGYFGLFSFEGDTGANNIGAIYRVNTLADLSILVQRQLPMPLGQYGICNVELMIVNDQISFDIHGTHIGVVTDTAVGDIYSGNSNVKVLVGLSNSLLYTGTGMSSYNFGLNIIPL